MSSTFFWIMLLVLCFTIPWDLHQARLRGIEEEKERRERERGSRHD